jgi:hypothetical protein
MDKYNMKELTISHLGISEKKYKQIKNQFLKSSKDIKSKLKSDIMLYYLNPYKILKVNKSILDESMKQELGLLIMEGVTSENYRSHLK